MSYRVPTEPLIPEWIWFAWAVLGIVGGVLTFGFALGQWVESRSCAEVTRVTSIPTRYSWGPGAQCFVQVNGRWIPRSAWREVP